MSFNFDTIRIKIENFEQKFGRHRAFVNLPDFTSIASVGDIKKYRKIGKIVDLSNVVGFRKFVEYLKTKTKEGNRKLKNFETHDPCLNRI